MTLAYLISAFTDAAQLQRLIGALNEDNAEFFIHIDKKTDAKPFQELCKAPNVHFLPYQKRHNIYWGTYSQVLFQMQLIREALDCGKPIDRLFMLSGQDYPLWNNQHIRQFLAEHPQEEFLSAICLDSPDVSEQHKSLYRLQRPQTDYPWLSPKWNDRLSLLWRRILKLSGMRQPLHLKVEGVTWPLYKGSDYFCITRDLAEYVYEQWHSHREIQRYFSRSFAPSETCIHTIALNSSKFAPHCLLSQGEYHSLAALTPLHYIVYDPVIKVMTEDDLPALLASGKMFARKFQSGKSDTLVELLNNRT